MSPRLVPVHPPSTTGKGQVEQHTTGRASYTNVTSFIARSLLPLLSSPARSIHRLYPAAAAVATTAAAAAAARAFAPTSPLATAPRLAALSSYPSRGNPSGGAGAGPRC